LKVLTSRPECSESDADYLLEAAIPGRDFVSLKRLPYWILLFRTPAAAASYQSRLRWYHQNAVENLPVNPLQAALIPGRGLTPPPGYIDHESGEDVWKRLHEYCLLQPSQDFSVIALLPEFPRSVLRAIRYHKVWNDGGEPQRWTVLVRVDGGQSRKEDICRFLETDGKSQNRPWEIVHNGSAHMPGHEQSTDSDVVAVFEETKGWRSTEESQTFSIKFRSEGEAMRFWRTWHRQPLSRRAEDALMPGHHAPCLYVELTW
jgi:hypothetical protein